MQTGCAEPSLDRRDAKEGFMEEMSSELSLHKWTGIGVF
jgi:hypothetical protein